jgi:lysophospholipase L1-like esterase
MRIIANVVILLALVACDKTTSPVGPPTSFSESEMSEALSSSSTGIQQSASTRALPFRRILCFGDSITSGATSRTLDGLTSLAIVEGYVSKLRRRLTREYGGGFELINSGASAEDTSDGLRRLDSELHRYRPDLVLLLEGVIDVNNPYPNLNQARDNLSKMMKMTLREGAACIIGTYVPLNKQGFRVRGAKNVTELNRVIRVEAAKQSVSVADHEEASEQNMSLQGPDGLHPNDDGYRLMADTWFQAILDLVAEMET